MSGGQTCTQLGSSRPRRGKKKEKLQEEDSCPKSLQSVSVCRQLMRDSTGLPEGWQHGGPWPSVPYWLLRSGSPRGNRTTRLRGQTSVDKLHCVTAAHTLRKNVNVTVEMLALDAWLRNSGDSLHGGTLLDPWGHAVPLHEGVITPLRREQDGRDVCESVRERFPRAAWPSEPHRPQPGSVAVVTNSVRQYQSDWNDRMELMVDRRVTVLFGEPADGEALFRHGHDATVVRHGWATWTVPRSSLQAYCPPDSADVGEDDAPSPLAARDLPGGLTGLRRRVIDALRYDAEQPLLPQLGSKVILRSPPEGAASAAEVIGVTAHGDVRVRLSNGALSGWYCAAAYQRAPLPSCAVVWRLDPKAKPSTVRAEPQLDARAVRELGPGELAQVRGPPQGGWLPLWAGGWVQVGDGWSESARDADPTGLHALPRLVPRGLPQLAADVARAAAGAASHAARLQALGLLQTVLGAPGFWISTVPPVKRTKDSPRSAPGSPEAAAAGAARIAVDTEAAASILRSLAAMQRLLCSQPDPSADATEPGAPLMPGDNVCLSPLGEMCPRARQLLPTTGHVVGVVEKRKADQLWLRCRYTESGGEAGADCFTMDQEYLQLAGSDCGVGRSTVEAPLALVDWTPEDVARWAEGVENASPTAAALFRATGWDGGMLARAGDEELQALGLRRVGERRFWQRARDKAARAASPESRSTTGPAVLQPPTPASAELAARRLTNCLLLLAAAAPALRPDVFDSGLLSAVRRRGRCAEEVIQWLDTHLTRLPQLAEQGSRGETATGPDGLHERQFRAAMPRLVAALTDACELSQEQARCARLHGPGAQSFSNLKEDGALASWPELTRPRPAARDQDFACAAECLHNAANAFAVGWPMMESVITAELPCAATDRRRTVAQREAAVLAIGVLMRGTRVNSHSARGQMQLTLPGITFDDGVEQSAFQATFGLTALGWLQTAAEKLAAIAEDGVCQAERGELDARCSAGAGKFRLFLLARRRRQGRPAAEEAAFAELVPEYLGCTLLPPHLPAATALWGLGAAVRCLSREAVGKHFWLAARAVRQDRCPWLREAGLRLMMHFRGLPAQTPASAAGSTGAADHTGVTTMEAVEISALRGCAHGGSGARLRPLFVIRRVASIIPCLIARGAQGIMDAEQCRAPLMRELCTAAVAAAPRDRPEAVLAALWVPYSLYLGMMTPVYLTADEISPFLELAADALTSYADVAAAELCGAQLPPDRVAEVRRNQGLPTASRAGMDDQTVAAVLRGQWRPAALFAARILTAACKESDQPQDTQGPRPLFWITQPQFETTAARALAAVQRIVTVWDEAIAGRKAAAVKQTAGRFGERQQVLPFATGDAPGARAEPTVAVAPFMQGRDEMLVLVDGGCNADLSGWYRRHHGATATWTRGAGGPILSNDAQRGCWAVSMQGRIVALSPPHDGVVWPHDVWQAEWRTCGGGTFAVSVFEKGRAEKMAQDISIDAGGKLGVLRKGVAIAAVAPGSVAEAGGIEHGWILWKAGCGAAEDWADLTVLSSPAIGAALDKIRATGPWTAHLLPPCGPPVDRNPRQRQVARCGDPSVSVPDPAATLLHGVHTGMWRSGQHCSVPRNQDGPFCAHVHSEEEITHPHWSCCGGWRNEQECTRVLDRQLLKEVLCTLLSLLVRDRGAPAEVQHADASETDATLAARPSCRPTCCSPRTFGAALATVQALLQPMLRLALATCRVGGSSDGTSSAPLVPAEELAGEIGGSSPEQPTLVLPALSCICRWAQAEREAAADLAPLLLPAVLRIAAERFSAFAGLGFAILAAPGSVGRLLAAVTAGHLLYATGGAGSLATQAKGGTADSDCDEDDGQPMLQLWVAAIGRDPAEVVLPADATVGDLRKRVARLFGVPAANLRLSFQERPLDDDPTELADVGVGAEARVDCVVESDAEKWLPQIAMLMRRCDDSDYACEMLYSALADPLTGASGRRLSPFSCASGHWGPLWLGADVAWVGVARAVVRERDLMESKAGLIFRQMASNRKEQEGGGRRADLPEAGELAEQILSAVKPQEDDASSPSPSGFTIPVQGAWRSAGAAAARGAQAPGSAYPTFSFGGSATSQAGQQQQATSIFPSPPVPPAAPAEPAATASDAASAGTDSPAARSADASPPAGAARTSDAVGRRSKGRKEKSPPSAMAQAFAALSPETGPSAAGAPPPGFGPTSSSSSSTVPSGGFGSSTSVVAQLTLDFAPASGADTRQPPPASPPRPAPGPAAPPAPASAGPAQGQFDFGFSGPAVAGAPPPGPDAAAPQDREQCKQQ
eukprot:TRINITY_DN18835_c0_g1_i1.p1 TRINITY_DN18835_c0_g1~~TRINITY_DN18835_c0_g1_i1.p1  ORF type:complete len:2314 (+),score=250.52 TRINITY_DN18835_c0_g1_i1:81-6944(+)